VFGYVIYFCREISLGGFEFFEVVILVVVLCDTNGFAFFFFILYMHIVYLLYDLFLMSEARNYSACVGLRYIEMFSLFLMSEARNYSACVGLQYIEMFSSVFSCVLYSLGSEFSSEIHFLF
jgi:hypothetical protein